MERYGALGDDSITEEYCSHIHEPDRFFHPPSWLACADATACVQAIELLCYELFISKVV